MIRGITTARQARRLRRPIELGFARGYREWPDPVLISGPPQWWIKAWEHGRNAGARAWRARRVA